nr:hypothetical protein [Angustibacter aerolatus]
MQASTVGDALKGRVAATVRFDGAAVELSGRLVGGPKVPTGTARAAVGDLPADTVAALAVGVAPGAVQQAWDNARATLKASGAEAQFDAQVQQAQQATGLQAPGDLAAALGDRVTVAVGAVQPTPQVAVRLGGDAAAVGKVRSVVEQAAGGTSRACGGVGSCGRRHRAVERPGLRGEGGCRLGPGRQRRLPRRGAARVRRVRRAVRRRREGAGAGRVARRWGRVGAAQPEAAAVARRHEHHLGRHGLLHRPRHDPVISHRRAVAGPPGSAAGGGAVRPGRLSNRSRPGDAQVTTVG